MRKISPNIGKSLTFHIQSVDGLGQGVDKSGDKVCFIGKTLAGETGTAHIISEKKGVRFAQLSQLTQTAPTRIKPACEHYQHCPGCDYLHTDYASELAYKTQTLQRFFQAFASAPKVQVHGAVQRLAYRNRVQLHYRGKRLGLLDASCNQIIEIPFCQLPEPALQTALKQLYEDRSWAKQHRGQGHCEIALIDGQATVFWNKPYAFGGFSQVNQAMNRVLTQLVTSLTLHCAPKHLLDLFSGTGNLSQALLENHAVKRLMIDVSAYQYPDFIALDLFQPDALAQFQQLRPQQQADVVLIDPPRKGFSALAQWLLALGSKHCVYVSCNAATMVRDIQLLGSQWQIEQLHLVDMFPSSRHFESIALLRLRS